MLQSKNTNTQEQINEKENADCLLEIYGEKSFVKIYQALAIGQIKFSFVNKDDPKNSIDCFVNADDFASDFINVIDSGELRNRAARAKQLQKEQNAKYASSIWESRAGMTKNKELRKFTIQPGSSQEFAFRATQGKKNIVVGFSFRELKLLSYRWKFLERDWNKIMSERYSLVNMTSSFRAEQDRKLYESQLEEEKNDNNVETTSTVMASSKIQNGKEASLQQSSTNQVKNSNSVKIGTYQVKVKTPLHDMENGGKAFQAWGKDNKQYGIIVRKEILEKPEVKILLSNVVAGQIINVTGGLKEGHIYIA